MGLSAKIAAAFTAAAFTAAAFIPAAVAEPDTAAAGVAASPLQSQTTTPTAAPGDTVGWNLTPTNTTSGDVSAEIAADIPAGTALQSAAAAPGWSLEYSTNSGATWTPTPPSDPATVNRVRAAGNMPDGGGTNTPLNPLNPSTAVQILGGGDGFNAVFYKDNLWLVNHHARAGDPQYGEWLKCFDKTTGAPCPGLNSGATFIPATSGEAFGSGPQEFDTPNASVSFIDQTTGRLYAPVQYAAGTGGVSPVGWVCGDLDTFTSCGFVQAGVENVAQDFGGKLLFTQFNPTNPVPSGPDSALLYAVGGSGKVYCFDAGVGALCPDSGAASVTGPVTLPDSQHMVQTSATPGAAGPSSGKVFAVHATGVDTWVLECADVQTGGECWAPIGLPDTFPAATSTAYSQPQPMFDTAGALQGVCTLEMGGWSSPTWHCYDTSGAASPTLVGVALKATPPAAATFGGRHTPTLPFDDNYLYSLMMYSHQVGSKLYIPWVLWPVQDAAGAVNTVTCLDFATGEACAGFTGLQAPYLENVVYTISSDDQDGNCLWWSGDKGRMAVFNATTGQAGCPWQSTTPLPAAPELCAPTDGLHYTDVTIPGLPQGVAVEVSVYDSQGSLVPLPGGNIIDNPTGSVDISTVPISGATSSIEVRLRAYSDNDTPLDGVTAHVGWDSTPALCAQVEPVAVCEPGPTLTLPASLTLTGPGGTETFNTQSVLDVTRGAADCTLALTKTIDGTAYPSPPGFPAEPSDTISYRFTVTTPGTFSLGRPDLWDDNATPGTPGDEFQPAYVSGDTNSNGRLDPGETWLYTHQRAAGQPGTYTNTATVTAPGATNAPQTAQAVYTSSENRLLLDKSTNGQPTGGEVAAGGPVTWTYVVTNAGPKTLTSIVLTDDREGPVDCPGTVLQPGGQMECALNGETVDGEYNNGATVTGLTPSGATVTAVDTSGYTGLRPQVDVVKTVNGAGNLDTPGGAVYEAAAGEQLSYLFVVTNRGSAGLGAVRVSDVVDGSGAPRPVDCPKDVLAVGESMTCAAGGTAVVGVETDTVTVTGQGVFTDGRPLTFRDGTVVPSVSDTSRAGYRVAPAPAPTPSPTPTVTPLDPTPGPTPAPSGSPTPLPAVLPPYTPAQPAAQAATPDTLATTGGATLWALWAGVGLIVVGGAAVAAARIRG